MSDAAAVSMRGVTKTRNRTPRIMRMLVRTTIPEDVIALSGVDLDVGTGRG